MNESGPIRVLVVDDEPDVQRLFELRFRREVRSGEFDLVFASSAVEALALIERHPDLEVMITDLNMPGMGGLALLERVSALRPALQSIVLTAYGDMTNIRTAMMRGAFDFQVKPLDIVDLRATITKASEIVRLLRAGERAERRALDLEVEKRRIQDLFGKYVSDDVVNRLIGSPDGITLQGERRHLTLLLADIRGFTRLTEVLSPERVVAVLNSYLEVASSHILEYGGTINEVLGDGLLVYFGAPIDDPTAAEHAVAAGVALQMDMSDLNERHRELGLPELAIGVAVHTGDAVLGTIGSESRMKYAAIGRNVNIVGRIETHARGGQVLISDATLAEVGDLVTTTGGFELRAKGVPPGLSVHAVSAIGGPYQLVLPQRAHEMRDVITPSGFSVARVIDQRVGETTPADLLAIGADGARLRTSLMLAPLDHVVIHLPSGPIFGTVSECDVSDDGRCDVTVPYTAVPDHAIAGIEGSAETET
jgi:adenylate cyclase